MVKSKRESGGEVELDRAHPEAGRATAGSGVVLGIGDDCAIFRARGAAEDLLFTTDMLIEDVHFRRATHSPADVGWKALARGLSDIAAMGGKPRFCLLSLALPPWADARWMEGFYGGFLGLAAREGAPLAGGDLARAEKAMCDVVVCGAAPRGRPCGGMAPAPATPSTSRARWAARRWGWPPAAGAPGGATCAPSRAWLWADTCASVWGPPPPWI